MDVLDAGGWMSESLPQETQSMRCGHAPPCSDALRGEGSALPGSGGGDLSTRDGTTVEGRQVRPDDREAADYGDALRGPILQREEELRRRAGRRIAAHGRACLSEPPSARPPDVSPPVQPARAFRQSGQPGPRKAMAASLLPWARQCSAAARLCLGP